MATFLNESKFIISTDTSLTDGADDPLSDTTEFVDAGEVRNWQVAPDQHAQRLDQVLAGDLHAFSRSYLQQLIAAGLVLVNNAVVTKSSTKVRAGDALTVELQPSPQTTSFRPESIPVDVVYEDTELLVLNKPAGLVVHPAAGNWSGTLLNGLLARYPAAMQVPRAGIVHRLDKDTSGLMVVARTRSAMDELVKRIAAREVRREYLALGHRAWQGERKRRVDAPIGRDPRNRLRMAIVDLNVQGGKQAATRFELMDSCDEGCLVLCTLETGRTHQIRVHMASLGHPLVGDGVYGGANAAGMSRQALHAYQLAFEHPVTGQLMAFHSPLPADFASAVRQWGLRYNEIDPRVTAVPVASD